MRYQKTMTAGEAVVECMKIENVTRAFTVPGESFLAVLDALEGQESIELIVNRHEGGAGFMAEGTQDPQARSALLWLQEVLGQRISPSLCILHFKIPHQWSFS